MGKIFKRGLLAVAPIALSIAIVVWLFKTMEEIFREPIILLVGKYYFPGLGIIVAFVLIFAVGIVINTYLMQKLTRLVDYILNHIPFFKIFYNSICDLMEYFKPKPQEKAGKVVAFELAGMRFIGLITREDFEGLPEGIGKEGDVVVYLPMSYQIGGYTVTVPRNKLQPLDISVEEGMRYVVTAGVIGNRIKRLGSKKTKHS